MGVLLARWRSLNEWFKALLIAVAVLGLLHAFVLRWVTVTSSSMYATLLPGDLLGVVRWPAWSGCERGDIAVFHDPIQDDRTMARRQLLVKRVAGVPGDVVELRDGKLSVNGKPVAAMPTATTSWMVRLRKGTDPARLLSDLDLPPAFVEPGRTMIELPLNAAMARAIRERSDVVSLEPMPTASGAQRHLFPFSPTYRWNSDDYGPIHVPKKGDAVRVDANTIAMYDRIISEYEHNKLEADGGHVRVNDEQTNRYVIGQDYYFVLGDSRDYSADSRYWGFVPADHLVGRASFIVLSADPAGGAPRAGRWFKGL